MKVTELRNGLGMQGTQKESKQGEYTHWKGQTPDWSGGGRNACMQGEHLLERAIMGL